MAGKKIDPLDIKTPDEVLDITFDYVDSLEAGETLVSAVVTVSIRKGADSTPAAILSGSPVVSSPYVVQRVINGVSGATYNLKCLATTNTGRKYELIGVLPVRSLA